MYLKLIFGILATIVLAQLLVRCLVSWRAGRSCQHMTPEEILRWRLANGEIDRCEYESRMRTLRAMITEALGRKSD